MGERSPTTGCVIVKQINEPVRLDLAASKQRRSGGAPPSGLHMVGRMGGEGAGAALSTGTGASLVEGVAEEQDEEERKRRQGKKFSEILPQNPN